MWSASGDSSHSGPMPHISHSCARPCSRSARLSTLVSFRFEPAGAAVSTSDQWSRFRAGRPFWWAMPRKCDVSIP
ncbi:hypothetical protein NJ76_26490 [Rhodococcus sp. IITR03]|nr:hypothetical protein NJ76_26490 [Rhodococcus sp. IITR03]